MEGIDMGNVISGARRSRTASAAAVNYKCSPSPTSPFPPVLPAGPPVTAKWWYGNP